MPGRDSIKYSCCSFNVNGFLFVNKLIGFFGFSNLLWMTSIKAAVSAMDFVWIIGICRSRAIEESMPRIEFGWKSRRE